MSVEAASGIQQSQSYIRPEATPRNQTLQKVAKFGVLIGSGLLLASFFLAGACITLFSLFSLHYLIHIDDGAKDGSNKLVKAAHNGNLCMLKFLFFLGANPNVCNPRNETPLYWAVYEDQDKAVDLLLKQGADSRIQLQATPIQEYLTVAIEDVLPARNVYEQALNQQRKYRDDPSFRENRITVPKSDQRTREERIMALDRIVEMIRQ